MTTQFDVWPGGKTWVFQGTILEDATGGTHVCTATISSTTGTEFQVMGGRIVVGNTATAQTAVAYVDDGINVLFDLLNAEAASGTTASLVYPIPMVATTAAVGSTSESQATLSPFIISGGMRVILKVTTAAVSVTQTFALVARIKGPVPAVTLLDTVGVSTNTVNTSRVF